MRRILFAIALLYAVTAAFAYEGEVFEREFRDMGGEDAGRIGIPPDYKDPAEFVFGRLMYPGGGGGFRRFGFGGGDWQSYAPTQGWGNDYPAADRHLIVALRRLTSMSARSVEQPVNLLDGDDVFNWPFLFAGRTTDISLTEEMVVKLREYLLRGGFLICDDMWRGRGEHEAILDLVKQLFPDRELVELGNNDVVMHSVFSLEDRHQIIGAWGRGSGYTEPFDGVSYDPHWKGIFDDKKNMVMGIWLNSDTADSWEYADDPYYPERHSGLGFRIIINHIVYAMSH